MPTDAQILAAGTAAAPLTYTVPNAAEFELLAVNANYDGSGAAGDFIPAVVIESDGGVVIARAADPSVVVTAGNDAEVSWFPGVKNAGARPTGLNPTTELWASGNTTLVSGAVTALNWTSFAFAGGTNQAFVSPGGGGFTTLTWANVAPIIATMIVDFPAAAYDRYIEFAIGNPFSPDYTNSPRIRESVSPDGDRLTLTYTVISDAGPPAGTLTMHAFQASGINRTVFHQMFIQAIPFRVT